MMVTVDYEEMDQALADGNAGRSFHVTFPNLWLKQLQTLWLSDCAELQRRCDFSQPGLKPSRAAAPGLPSHVLNTFERFTKGWDAETYARE